MLLNRFIAFGIAILGIAVIVSNYLDTKGFVHDTTHPTQGIVINPQMAGKYQIEIDIIHKLEAVDPNLAKKEIHLKILDTDVPNAYSSDWGSDGAMVAISRGMIFFTKGDVDELALILGHELTHVLNGDVYRWTARGKFCDTSNANSRQCEHDADLGGQRLSHLAGFNECKASAMFLRFGSIFGEIGPDDDHPMFKDRAKYTSCQNQ